MSVRTREGTANIVRDVSFTVAPGDFVGIVGESGSGKTMTLMNLLRLTHDPNLTVSGHVWFGGEDLLTLSEKRLQEIRGGQIAVIFQDAMTALTPVYTVGWHIAEQLRAHQNTSQKAAHSRAIELLKEVGIPAPEVRVNAYPHELSGGMRQRAVIAMALACEPSILLADEPTTALDVTTQAQILDLMQQLQSRHGSAVIFVTHDVGVVAQAANKVMVMYSGRIVEQGPTQDVLATPQHPYTWGLLGSIPKRGATRRTVRLVSIPGVPPSPLTTHDGCAFADRCAFVHERCVEQPPLVALAKHPDHSDACWLPRSDRESLRARVLVSAQPADPNDTAKRDQGPA
ncbi:ABC transporter ATP-binding protein [Leekyejoonella antrihumi]|uniref:ABC transporter ATP-binding protein n=1 Tax=Leekyejoonella antrihumi TaxID=1660198 RepID=UPI001C98E2B6|nr:ABC transporter ATP-binding protein [Leekyejoonella antrihumi]